MGGDRWPESDSKVNQKMTTATQHLQIILFFARAKVHVSVDMSERNSYSEIKIICFWFIPPVQNWRGRDYCCPKNNIKEKNPIKCHCYMIN